MISRTAYLEAVSMYQITQPIRAPEKAILFIDLCDNKQITDCANVNVKLKADNVDIPKCIFCCFTCKVYVIDLEKKKQGRRTFRIV